MWSFIVHISKRSKGFAWEMGEKWWSSMATTSVAKEMEKSGKEPYYEGVPGESSGIGECSKREGLMWAFGGIGPRIPASAGLGGKVGGGL